MTKRRDAVSAAAIAFVLSAPMATSSNPALADELSDLRANQELLQRRLDQLAQAIPASGSPYPSGPPGPTTVQMMGGSFPRSFLVPGTNTSIRVGGEIRLLADYFIDGGNPNQGVPWNSTIGNNGQLNAIPVAGVTRTRSRSIFGMTPRESKLSIETRTPSAWGEARTFMEFDWAGSTPFAPGGGAPTHVADNLHPRLRYAYGTLGGILAGQANSNFSDSDAGAETLDFGGNTGGPGVVRVPQIRYTIPLAPWGFPGSFSASAEQPATEIWAPATGIIAQDGTPADPAGSRADTTTTLTAASVVSGPTTVQSTVAPVNPTKTPAPDLTMAWYIPQPWGHVDFSAVLRPALQVKDGLFIDRTFTGWGVNFSGDVKPRWFGWDRDYFTWHVVYGVGIGRYHNSSGGFALVSNYPAASPTTAAAAASVIIKPTVNWGGDVGYQHRWLPNLRSTVSAGVWNHEINSLRGAVCGGPPTATGAKATGAGGCGLNKEIITAHANLIWDPVPFVDFGVEYVYAHRLTLSNANGDMNAMIGRMRVRF